MNPLSAQVVISAVVVYLLQLAKKSRLIPWLTMETGRLNRVVAVIASLLSAVGIHFTYNRSQGVLVISGLTLVGIATFAWRWLVSFVSQQLIFQTAVQKPAVTPEQISAGIQQAIGGLRAQEQAATAAGGKS
jgi:hypothetical protein